MILTFVLGFYTAIYSQELNAITPSINILAIVTGVSAGINILKIIKDWITDKKNTPNLEYHEIVKKDMSYYLRIKKTKGEKNASGVRGFITIENTRIKNAPMTWDYDYTHSIDINHYRDLNLFINNTPSITFPLVDEQRKNWFLALIGLDFKNVKAFETTNRILIQIQSENAKVPPTQFIKSFDDIRSNAKDETIAKIE